VVACQGRFALLSLTDRSLCDGDLPLVPSQSDRYHLRSEGASKLPHFEQSSKAAHMALQVRGAASSWNSAMAVAPVSSKISPIRRGIACPR
jgi:hypothetical protein